MTDNSKVLDALAKLDKTDDAQWTDDGLPRVNVVQELAEDTTLTRAQLNEIAPGFSRNPPAKKTEIKDEGSNGATSLTQAGHPMIDDEFDARAEPEVNGFGGQMSEDQARAVLTRRIGDAEARLERARAAVNEANSELRRCEQRVTRAIADSNRRFPPVSFAANIKAHLAAQQARKIAEAAERDGGIGQLDLAMQRRNSRGWSRPARPVQNSESAAA